MNMLVSGISSKEGKKVAYIMFEDGARQAEAIIPECKVTSNKGFTKDEIEQLETYMYENLAMLKRQASGVDPIKSMLQDQK